MIEYDKTLELPMDYKYNWIAARKSKSDDHGYELTIVDNIGNPVTIWMDKEGTEKFIQLLKEMNELIK